MIRSLSWCAAAYLALSCTSPAIPDEGITPTLRIAAPPTGLTIATRFEAPAGCTRTPLADSTFGSFLRGLPLKPEGAAVHLYDGSLKYREDVHAAVVDLSVGTRDLQQCADAVMRLRAEHLFAQGRYNDIAFHFTNGFEVPFSRWAKGDRIKVQGDRCDWKLKEGTVGFTHDNLLAYLQLVFSYAGTLSLTKELKDAHAQPLEPGDVFIHGGSPGHAMMVMDVARGPDGRTFFLLAQSYMPAQEVHVVKNMRWPELGAWFELNDGDELVTPEWTFIWSERKRW